MPTMNPSHWEQVSPTLDKLAEKLGKPYRVARPAYSSRRHVVDSDSGVKITPTLTDRGAFECTVTAEGPRPVDTIPPFVGRVPLDDFAAICYAVGKVKDRARAHAMQHKADAKAFECDLRAVLAKHRASIDFRADGCSDWHGITGEQIGFFIGSGFVAVSDSTSFDASHLDE